MNRQLISSQTPWESLVGYSRAVRVDNQVEVSGTVAMDGEQLIGEGDPYLQAKFALEKMGKALEEAGASFADVIRTRIYVVDINHWQAITKAHAEIFATIRPACTLVKVAGLIDERLLVEIEASAIISS